jgi:hypothetical protein
MARLVVVKEERIVWKTEQQRRLFHDLVNRMLDWGSVRIGKRVEVERYNCNPVRELFWQ